MVKMILTVPRGFNVELFCNAATAMVRDAAENEYERRDYDYSLGEWVRHSDFRYQVYCQLSQNREQYEVNADFVDLAHLDALRQLQTICPQVELHFENCGDGENCRSVYDDDYLFQNRNRYEVKRNFA